MMTRLVLFFGFTMLLPAVVLGQTNQVFFVAPNGNDAQPGTLSRPFASLSKALSAASGTEKPTEIVLRTGTYEVEKPLVIDRSNLHIKAYPNEKPVITGGKRIRGRWEKVGANRWKTKVPTYFRQLFVNGQRATRARFPNAGSWASQWFQPDTIQTKEKRLVLNKPFPARFADLKGVEMHATAWWHWLRQKVDRFDPTNRAVFLVTEPSPECSGRKMDTFDRIYFENHLAFLDTDNEWYLDSLTHTLYYQSSEQPNRLSFVYPVTETIFFVKGTEQKPLTNIRLEGIGITHTEVVLPDSERKGIQAGYWGTAKGKPVFAPPAALMMTWATDCHITACHFTHLGEGALVLGDGCRKNRIENNRFDDIGSNVIQIGWRSGYVGEGHPLHYVPRNPAAVPSDNVVHNNHLQKFATTDHGSVGILIGYAHHNQLTHNLLEDFPYTGISMGWRWDTLPNPTSRNLIEWNEVRNGMQYLSDGGGIYTAGRQEGSRILNNWVHGMGGGPGLGDGIYNDEGSSYFELAHNYVERVRDLFYKFHQNILPTVNAHDNNGRSGRNDMSVTKNPKVFFLQVTDRSPEHPELYGLLK